MKSFFPGTTVTSLPLLLVLSAASLVSPSRAHSTHPILVVVSFDGFRYDYLNRTDTPTFDALAADGVQAPWIESRFITKTFPNHHSIATGLYEETHGIVANNFYDPALNDTFSVDDTDAKWWDTGAVPLWVGNQMAGSDRYSGGMMWPGTNAWIKNQTAYHVEAYNSSAPWEDSVDTVVGWLLDPTTPANCVFLYFDQPDSAGHAYGPDSPEVTSQIARADNIIGYLVSRLKNESLFDLVNLIVTSDHGMSDIPPPNVIDMTEIVNGSLYQYYGASPIWSLLPVEGQETAVYDALTEASKTMQFLVYKKEDIPDQYHYKYNDRILDILVVANDHWAIFPYETDPQSSVTGNHGYNNSNPIMHPFFLAHGPAFKSGYQAKPFLNIDLYPMMCCILGIEPSPNNGTLDHVTPLLKNPTDTCLQSNKDGGRSVAAPHA